CAPRKYQQAPTATIRTRCIEGLAPPSCSQPCHPAATPTGNPPSGPVLGVLRNEARINNDVAMLKLAATAAASRCLLLAPSVRAYTTSPFNAVVATICRNGVRGVVTATTTLPISY